MSLARMHVYAISLMALLLCAPAVWAQTAETPPLSAVSGSPAPSLCEQQVQEQYRQLSADSLVIQATAPQWGPQLIAIVEQLRVRSNQYELKKNQAEFAEQNWLRNLAAQRMKTMPEVQSAKGEAPPAVQ